MQLSCDGNRWLKYIYKHTHTTWKQIFPTDQFLGLRFLFIWILPKNVGTCFAGAPCSCCRRSSVNDIYYCFWLWTNFCFLFRLVRKRYRYWSSRGVSGPRAIFPFGYTWDRAQNDPFILETKWLGEYGKVYGVYRFAFLRKLFVYKSNLGFVF